MGLKATTRIFLAAIACALPVGAAAKAADGPPRIPHGTAYEAGHQPCWVKPPAGYKLHKRATP